VLSWLGQAPITAERHEHPLAHQASRPEAKDLDARLATLKRGINASHWFAQMFNPREAQWEWLIAASYDDYALIEPERVTIVHQADLACAVGLFRVSPRMRRTTRSQV
jgi:hypothetical protein